MGNRMGSKISGRVQEAARAWTRQRVVLAAPETVVFEGVDVVGDAGTAFLCSVETKQVWVPLTEIRYGTDLTKPGDRGKLILSRWFAQHLDLR